jgi:E3 ubiquitin-protein ligase SIAH1
MASSVVKSESQIWMDLKKELHNDLYEFLVCQNCEAVPKEGPIYTCDSGSHETCHNCIFKSKICKCNADIKVRNKGLEKVRNTLPLSCKFRKNGCNTILTLESLLYHEVDCQWRPILCPSLGCDSNYSSPAKIIFNSFANHLTEHHSALANELKESLIESHFTDIRDDLLTKTTTQFFDFRQPRKLTLNGAEFFSEMVLVKKRFFIWVYYYGSKEEAKNYICTIRAYGGSDNEDFSYNGPPRSLEESFKAVIDGDCGLSISRSQAKRIVSEKNMKYSIKISCLKEEARDEDVESGISDNENTTSNNST